MGLPHTLKERVTEGPKDYRRDQRKTGTRTKEKNPIPNAGIVQQGAGKITVTKNGWGKDALRASLFRQRKPQKTRRASSAKTVREKF